MLPPELEEVLWLIPELPPPHPTAARATMIAIAPNHRVFMGLVSLLLPTPDKPLAARLSAGTPTRARKRRPLAGAAGVQLRRAPTRVRKNLGSVTELTTTAPAPPEAWINLPPPM